MTSADNPRSFSAKRRGRAERPAADDEDIEHSRQRHGLVQHERAVLEDFEVVIAFGKRRGSLATSDVSGRPAARPGGSAVSAEPAAAGRGGWFDTVQSFPSRRYMRCISSRFMRTPSAASEHRDLIAALVYRTVAVKAFGDGERGAVSLVAGNQPWCRPGTETECSGRVVR